MGFTTTRTKPPVAAEDLFTICDPQGCLIHTTVSRKPEEAIDEWMRIEAASFEVFNWCDEWHRKNGFYRR